MSDNIIKRFVVLDSFRGLCALAVVAFHMRVVGSFTELGFFRSSFLFVEFFFALSGFVLTHKYGSRENLGLNQFVLSRTFRLLPVHLFMLLCFLALEAGKYLTEYAGVSLNNPPFSGSNSLAEIIPNALLLQAWLPFTEPQSFNAPSWSISIEYYLYLIFAVTIAFLPTQHRATMWLLISVAGFWSLASSAHVPTQYAARGLSCFFAGSITYTLFASVRDRLSPTSAVATLAEAASLIAVIVFLGNATGRDAPFTGVLFGLVILIFAFEKGNISKYLSARPLLHLGEISYCVYMIHYAILLIFVLGMTVASKITALPLAPVVDGIRFIDTGSVFLNNLTSLAVLGVVVCAAGLVRRYVELPGIRAGKMIAERSVSRSVAA